MRARPVRASGGGCPPPDGTRADGFGLGLGPRWGSRALGPSSFYRLETPGPSLRPDAGRRSGNSPSPSREAHLLAHNHLHTPSEPGRGSPKPRKAPPAPTGSSHSACDGPGRLVSRPLPGSPDNTTRVNGTYPPSHGCGSVGPARRPTGSPRSSRRLGRSRPERPRPDRFRPRVLSEASLDEDTPRRYA